MAEEKIIDLSKNLQGYDKAVFFVATVGIEIDRLIKKYSVLSPTKAVIFQAIGAERIESLCNNCTIKPANLLYVPHHQLNVSAFPRNHDKFPPAR